MGNHKNIKLVPVKNSDIKQIEISLNNDHVNYFTDLIIYQCGFEPTHRIKNFFADNYDHPMFEQGVQLIDMLYLKKNLI